MRLARFVAVLTLAMTTALAGEPLPVSIVPVPLPHLPLGVVSFPSGKAINVSVSPGAGAFRAPGDPEGRIWTITDRGPSVDCSEQGELTGPDGRQLCAGGMRGRIYFLPGYAPSIYAIDIAANRARFAEMIVLTGTSGKPLTGIVNPSIAGKAELAVTVDGAPLAPDPSGVSPGALVRLADGRFWIADNFGPSLLEVDPSGRVLRRLVPAASLENYRNADYPVEPVLPDVLGLRQVGRGFEGLAVAPDGDSLYVAMQSAVMNPDIEAYRFSSAVRILKIDRATGRTLAQFLYRLDPPVAFAGTDPATPRRQSEVKVTELSALPDGRLLVLERLGGACRFYWIDLSTATPLPDALDSPAFQPPLEARAEQDWAGAGLVPIAKTLLASTGSEALFGRRLNGMAVLSGHDIAVIANNDFGIDGSRTQMFRLTLPETVLK